MKNILTILFLILYFTFNIIAQDIKEEFKPAFKPWGYAFGDYFYKIAGDTAKFGLGEFSKIDKDRQGFTFRRVYLGLDAAISPDFSGSIVLEASDNITIGSGDRGIFLKLCYIEWKNLIPSGSIFIGQSSTPTWLLPEKIWSYRAIEKSTVDFHGFGGSNDLGVAVMGKFDKAGMFGYHFMIGNGRGSKPENNKLKKFYGAVDASLLGNKLIIQPYADYQEDDELKSKFTLRGFAAFQSEKFTIGSEVVHQVQKNYYTTDSTNIVPFAFSVFAYATLVKNTLKAFGKFDYYDPDTKYDTSRTYTDKAYFYKENFLTVGLDYTPISNFHIMPNIWINMYSDKRNVKTDRKADVVSRFTFYFIFK